MKKQKTPKKYNTWATIKRLVADLKPIAWALILAGIVCGGSVALSMLGPDLIGQLTDIIYNFGLGMPIDFTLLLELSVKLLLVYAGLGVLSMTLVVMMTNITTRYYTYTTRVRLSEKLTRVPVSYIDNTQSGELLSRMMNDVSNMSTTIHVLIELFVSGVLQLVVIIYIMYTVNVYMATIVVVLVPLSLLLAAFISSKSEAAWHNYRKINGKVYAFVEEDFTGFDTVKAFNLESRQKELSGDLVGKHSNELKRGFWMSGLVPPVIAFTNSLSYIIICILGGYFVVNNTITVGDVVMIILYAKMFAGPLESIAQGMSSVNRTIASASRVYGVLDEPEVPAATSDLVPEGAGDVEISNVNFAYVKDKPLIKNLNISVKAGQKVAIVGPTGGGKTTIVNLLMRFYDVDSGSITIDGVDALAIDRAKLRSQFSMVLQDTWLFSGTIYENIAYGKANATREEVMDAARRAHIDYFIDTLPDGYDTVINEESNNISSGQKQLLTIARAYLANRKMLILDEATSNVDTRTELLIQATMDELMANRTSFVIAHRLSTIVNADVILVVRDGEIVEQGTHQQLLAQNGFYSEIYNSQYDLLK
jgi:ATP-binding cassette subfamily B protein